MPTLKLEYRILLSSPSDVADERQVAAAIVSELSDSWGAPNGAVLKLLAWENDVAPGFGVEPQSVINSGLGDSWDIYLGIMHSRFGSPTKRYGSGTEEEFRRAHELWQKEQQSRALLFYFKKAPVDFDAIDAEQIGKVRAFKTSMSGLGGLYREFSDVSSFRDLLRAHLTSVLVTIHSNHSSLPTTNDRCSDLVAVETEHTHPDDSDPGLVDLVEDAFAGLTDLTTAIEGLGKLMADSTVSVQEQGVALKSASDSGDVPGMRSAVSSLSNGMLDLAKGLAEKRREYAASSRRAFEALSRAISLAKSSSSTDFDADRSLRDSIGGALSMLEQYASIIHATERSMDALPHLAREFTSARLLLKREFGLLRSELHSSRALMKDLAEIANGN